MLAGIPEEAANVNFRVSSSTTSGSNFTGEPGEAGAAWMNQKRVSLADRNRSYCV
jgi:hypothetical protein